MYVHVCMYMSLKGYTCMYMYLRIHMYMHIYRSLHAQVQGTLGKLAWPRRAQRATKQCVIHTYKHTHTHACIYRRRIRVLGKYGWRSHACVYVCIYIGA